MSLPTDTEQLAFIGHVQRLLEEGQFTATYKYALLMALVDIAVERGSDDGNELQIPLLVIADKFAEYYWGHTRPFAGKGVLRQNTGTNIAVLSILGPIQMRYPSLSESRRQPEWQGVLRAMARLVKEMPLLKLQRLRSGGLLEFLYDNEVKDGAITLRPGVAFCLRRCAALIRALARQGWLAAIRANSGNAYLVADGTNLEEFLFGADRVPLVWVREVLDPIQSGTCFYCGSPMRDAVHVDHFVPFSLYPVNLAHNLVLAHAGCNGDKLSLLADLPHLDLWLARNDRHGVAIGDALAERGILSDQDATLGIARWAYHRAQEQRALLWVRRRETRAFPADVVLSF
ncbi:MAG: HNH endonuclease [Burkholderiales bacterium]